VVFSYRHFNVSLRLVRHVVPLRFRTTFGRGVVFCVTSARRNFFTRRVPGKLPPRLHRVTDAERGGALSLRHEHLRLRTKKVSRESYCVGRGMDKQSPALQVNSAFVLCVAHFLSTNDQSSRQSNRVRKQRWIWSSQKHAPVAGTAGTDLAGPGKGAGLGLGHRPGTSVAFVASD
jgi:hypothetical protein